MAHDPDDNFWVKRWDAVIELHPPESYTSPNYGDAGQWEWLQQDHGKPIYMQEADPAVPNAVEYPLDEINDALMSKLTWKGYKVYSYKSTAAYAIALAIFQGYEQIDIYGIEMEHSSEYHSQQPNFAMWVGVALGRGVKVDMHCSRGLFDGPLYAYEITPEIRIHRYLEGLGIQKADIDKQSAMIEGAQMVLRQILQDDQPT